MYHENISIIGSKKFIEQTVKSLKLIKRKSKNDFNRIKKYLKRIKSAKYSRMVLEKAQYNVGKLTAFSDLEWYASTIVHDTYHYYLHFTGKLLWKKGNYTKHEKLCINEQLRFLKKIKAKKQIIENCKKAFKTKYWHKKNKRW